MSLKFYILPSSDSETNITKNLPKFESEDALIFVREIEKEFKVRYAKTDSYQRKQKYNTVWDELVELDEQIAQKCEQNSKNASHVNLTNNDEDWIKSCLINVFKQIIQKSSVTLPNLSRMVEEMENESDEESVETKKRSADMMEVDFMADQRSIRARIEDQDVNYNPTTLDELTSLIEIVDEAMKYDGFNPKSCRIRFMRNKTDVNGLKDLLLSFSAYANVGNNMSRLTDKRSGLSVTRRVLENLSAIGITKKSNSRDGLTLPRIAISFMPFYLIYRKFIAKNLQNQTSSNLNIVYKDIAFVGCNRIRNMEGYDSFYNEFASLITDPESDIDIKDPGFLKETQKWKKISLDGYAADIEIHDLMNEAMSVDQMDRKEAIEWIGERMMSICGE